MNPYENYEVKTNQKKKTIHYISTKANEIAEKERQDLLCPNP